MKSGFIIVRFERSVQPAIMLGKEIKNIIFWFADDFLRRSIRLPGNRRFFLKIILINFFLFSACASVTKRMPSTTDRGDPLEARELLSVLKEKNIELKTYKGRGKITFWNKNKKDLIAGAAWIGSDPDSLRFVLRSVTGQPLISFANNGKWFYLISHTQDQFYKKRSTDSNLKRFTSIPIRSIDMVSVLAGRVPVQEHSYATLIKSKSGDGYILILGTKWGNVLEKIYLDENKKDVRKVEIFGNNGVLVYRVELSMIQDVEGYRIPFHLVFSNGDGLAFQLNIDRYWADVSVSPTVFELMKPEQSPF